MKSIKSYVKEISIVIIGVLVALFVSNIKEERGAKEYYKASIETINNEIEVNYLSLKKAMEKKMQLVDSIKKYNGEETVLGEVIDKCKGIKSASLNNIGFDLYKRNPIDRIDFEMMSDLITMNNKSETIDSKMKRLTDFAYLKLLDSSRTSKMIFLVQVKDVLGSEAALLNIYQEYIDNYIDMKNDSIVEVLDIN